MDSEKSCLDHEALRSAQSLGGEELVVELIDAFFQFATKQRAKAHAAAAREDWRSVGLAIHPLKSSAGNVGATTVASLAEEIDVAAVEGEHAEIPSLLEALEQAYAAAESELRQLRDQLAHS